MKALTIGVDRDSVAAGDDCVSHAATIAIAPTATVLELIAAALAACPLAGIIGGRATWIVDAGGSGEDSIAVIAEQWTDAKLLVPATVMVARLFTRQAPTIYFRYWCQADPDAVFEALRAGAALPSRHE